MKKEEEFMRIGGRVRRTQLKTYPVGNRYPKTNPRRTPAGQIVTLQCHRRTSPSKLARSYRLE